MPYLYRDETIEVTESGVLIPRFTFPLGRPRWLTFGEIAWVERLKLNLWNGRYWIWGTIFFRTWWPLDLRRPRAEECIVLNLADPVVFERIALTPRDPAAAEAAIASRLAAA